MLPTVGTKHRPFRFIHCLILVSYGPSSGPSHPCRTLDKVLPRPVMHEPVSALGRNPYAPQEAQPEPGPASWKVLSALKGPLVNRGNLSQTPHLPLTRASSVSEPPGQPPWPKPVLLLKCTLYSGRVLLSSESPASAMSLHLIQIPSAFREEKRKVKPPKLLTVDCDVAQPKTRQRAASGGALWCSLAPVLDESVRETEARVGPWTPPQGGQPQLRQGTGPPAGSCPGSQSWAPWPHVAGSRQPLPCLCLPCWARSWHWQGRAQGEKGAVVLSTPPCCLLWGW